MSPKKEGGGVRINGEFFNSQTFHNKRMADDQFQQLLLALIDILTTIVQPSIFIGTEGKIYYLDWINLNLKQLIMTGLKKIKVFQYHCTWTNMYLSFAIYYQNKPNQKSNWWNEHWERKTIAMARNITTIHWWSWNLMSVAKYLSGKKAL